jgi:phytoene dehydrogenase-like protein
MAQAADAYDVIIIGAGIGGLVCGCYLAKAGMKVLIVEQHHKPGGYCTSFTRKGFTFDAAAHSFGGYREGGIVRKVFDDFALSRKLRIDRYDPSDRITMPDGNTIGFWAENNRTIHDFCVAFPDQCDQIRRFFAFLMCDEPAAFIPLRNLTFQSLLDQYFTNEKLKAVLAFPILGNGGLPPSLISAYIGVRLVKEFLLDGGYYPQGGMQHFADALADVFRSLGGDLRLAARVGKIQVRNNAAAGIRLETGEFIGAGHVVANCDAIQLYTKLLGRRFIKEGLALRLNAVVPSLSMFVLYLGIDHQASLAVSAGTNYWHLPHYDIDRMYHAATKRSPANVAEYMVRVSPDGRTLLAFVNAAYRTENYWRKNKEAMMSTLIEKIERQTIASLSKSIIYRDAATPETLRRYTLNHRGAAYGWAGLISQVGDPELRRPFKISGMSTVGHWSSQGMGIPSVVYSGYDTACGLSRRIARNG